MFLLNGASLWRVLTLATLPLPVPFSCSSSGTSYQLTRQYGFTESVFPNQNVTYRRGENIVINLPVLFFF